MSEAVPTSSPHEIGGYTIIEPLRGGETFLAEAPGGRKIVLKILPADCLLEDQLHPAIYERLARVRELAERNVANLHGVERDGEFTYLVWDFVPGVALSEWGGPSRGATERNRRESPHPGARERGQGPAQLSYRELLFVARELVLTIESLHGAGIVHGAINPGNVIFDRDDAHVRVTHVSPMLHNDPQRDADAIVQVLQSALETKKDRESPLGAALQQARMQRANLRQLSDLLANVPEPGKARGMRGEPGERKPSRGIAKRALWAALLVLILGVGLSIAASIYVRRANDPYRLIGGKNATTQKAASPATVPTTAQGK